MIKQGAFFEIRRKSLVRIDLDLAMIARDPPPFFRGILQHRVCKFRHRAGEFIAGQVGNPRWIRNFVIALAAAVKKDNDKNLPSS